MRKFPSLLTLLLILISLVYTFYSSKPQKITDLKTSKQEFSTLRALEHVKNISKQSHYLGSLAHEGTKTYILDELKKLGLQPEIQEGISISKGGAISRPKNIIAKIKGSNSTKSLVLMSHYDSSPHSSYGASDAGSGVATILEGIRAYLATNKVPKNDIIICITDGEEIGLIGADLFVKKHPWAKNVGLALNFEARGSGGNSYMLIETNGKNGKMIEEFSKARVKYPVTNSLAYSIYKMLPNDTDLTVLRKQGDIEGFNFAFIDDHFDYHTANDTWQNLDLNTLQHQGSYLIPLLSYFSEIDLSVLKSDRDYIYFNTPIFNLIKYPFSWIYALLSIAIILFIGLIFYGKFAYRIDFKEALLGLGAFLLCLILAGGITFGGWQLIKIIYPHYNEIQHGFTYNGYQYITVFVLLSIAICFKVYAKFSKSKNQASLLVGPLFIWLVVCTMAALYLKGASYFIIVVLFGLISLVVLIRQKRPNSILMVILALPAIFIISPFIAAFPVALGLKILFVSSILSVLLFGALIPVFGFYQRKNLFGNLCLLLSLVFFIAAHIKSDFTETRQKPNSLVYILDTDQNKAVWASYDNILDSWTQNYINPEENIAETYNVNTLQSKYRKSFAYANQAPIKSIRQPKLDISKDTIIGNLRHMELCIAPQRDIQRVDLYTETLFNFDALRVNGETAKDFTYYDGNTYNAFTKRWSQNLLTYHVSKNQPLELQMQFHKDSLPKFVLYESSYDLLANDHFSIPERDKNMMPKPFVINDAVVIKKGFAIEEYEEKKIDTTLTLDNTPIQVQEINE
ncbi:peptidase M28 [Aquimarina atlantica]|uniref:Vacuolar membrane protease n=1 Tax=Aquimarina atlantica TaxID=1317122 RepID=A0A023BQ26_9FLAO|nr:M28 family peptidase [Aquimarina atlantica]EZH71808.1 peptidase M28 [Aquimarina atlantica]